MLGKPAIVGAFTRHEPLPFVHVILACEREVRVVALRRCWSLLTSHDVDGKRRRLELWTTSSSPFIALPTNSFSRFDPQPFRVFLLRRLHLTSFCPHASADVAVHSILVATIGPRVLWQGFLGEGVTRWRVLLPGFASRRVRGSAPVSWSGTWTFCLQPPWMAEDWKLLPPALIRRR